MDPDTPARLGALRALARPGPRAVLLLLAVLLCSVSSVLLRPDTEALATWWPAAGLGMALLALSPRRWWWLLLLATAAITLLSSDLGGRPTGVGVALALANGVELVVGALVLQGRRAEPPRLVDTGGWFRLLVAATLGASAMAVVAEVGMLLLGRPVGVAAPTVLPSHLAATLVVLPLLLLTPAGPRRRATLELGTQTGLLAAAVALGALGGPGVGTFPDLLLPLPLLVWAALRFSPRLAAAQVAAVAVATTAATARGVGAIADLTAATAGTVVDAGSAVQAYLVCMAMLAVPIALASQQRRELVARLDRERELSATTLASTLAIIIVTDGRGTIERVNAALNRLTGFTPDDLVGRPIWQTPLIPLERREGVREIFADPGGGSMPARREADVMTADGQRLRVVWSTNVVLGEDGLVEYLACTATDVTSERTSSQLVEHLFSSPKAAPMLYLDPDLVVTLCNAASAQLFGTAPTEVEGSPLISLVCPEQRSDMEQALARAREVSRETRAAATLDHQWSWMRPDGSVVRLSATVSAVVDAVGRQVGTLLVASDVTQQLAQAESVRRALETERRAVERLRRLDTAKNDFVSTVSHELRTPTTSIVGYTEMLRDEFAGEVNDEQRALLEVIARNGTRLIAVANDLLTLASLESGDTDPHAGPGDPGAEVDLATVVAQSREALAPLLGDRSLDVVVDVPPGPVVVTGDADHLDRVVLNLLSNAVKFTPDGGSVRCVLRGEGPEAVLEVSDTGIGIPEAEQAELFTKFFRSSTAQDRAIPGTGLGLSIIHRIVSDHGGRVQVRSSEGVGTTFTVLLPLAVAPVVAPAVPLAVPEELPEHVTAPDPGPAPVAAAS